MAIANYHDTFNVIPPGRIWGPTPTRTFPAVFQNAQNTTWFCLMLPFFEQGNLANSFNYTWGGEGTVTSDPTGAVMGLFVNSTVSATKMSAFQCPSDRTNTFQINQTYATAKGIPALGAVIMTKGNYAASWGNTNWGAQYKSSLMAQYIQSAFGHDGQVSIGKITDGTSNTIYMSEVLQGAINDIRGAMWSTVPGGSNFMTRYTPNGQQDYLNLIVGGDLLNNNPGLFCTNEPVQGLPCVAPGIGDSDAFAGSRSKHPGGVNAGYGDGSVHFIKNTIAPNIWRGLNTIAAGEVISADAY